MNCELRTQRNRAAQAVSCLSGLRFPLATFLRVIPALARYVRGASAPSGLEVVPSPTNDFSGRGFRKVSPVFGIFDFCLPGNLESDPAGTQWPDAMRSFQQDAPLKHLQSPAEPMIRKMERPEKY